ncbi:phage protein [Salinarimonas soli]|uniref:DUF3277 family protein n=1 Tax=Salinarimonas soli TaxID=1638099 RepID=A0A5B2VEX6_9HYPH|nr:phage protein [Salinarimonas soli]KAA2237671.1 DUF3277 family protein [Salinarimonas soli]
MATYSFLDVQAAIVGPGGSFSLSGEEAGVAEEGITITMLEDKNTMQVGAGGGGQHSLHGGRAGTVAVTLLKTSPVNALLSEMYNFQTMSSALHGQNTIVVRNPVRGDEASARLAAFKKLPDNVNQKVAGTNTWMFDAIFIDQRLGAGLI